jgi:hypothetical protein
MITIFVCYPFFNHLENCETYKKKKSLDHQVQVLLSPHFWEKFCSATYLRKLTIQLCMKMHAQLCVKHVIGTK